MTNFLSVQINKFKHGVYFRLFYIGLFQPFFPQYMRSCSSYKCGNVKKLKFGIKLVGS